MEPEEDKRNKRERKWMTVMEREGHKDRQEIRVKRRSERSETEKEDKKEQEIWRLICENRSEKIARE